jgi:hypothetical protein
MKHHHRYRQKASADILIPLTELPLSSLQVSAHGTATYPASTDEPVNPVSATPGSLGFEGRAKANGFFTQPAAFTYSASVVRKSPCTADKQTN